MTDRELMQQALDALFNLRWAASERDKKNRIRQFDEFMDGSDEAIEALRARLAQPEQRSEQWWKHEVSNAWAEGYEKGRASVKQPEQEPVAWIKKDRSSIEVSIMSAEYMMEEGFDPLYTAPPQREDK